MIWTCYRDMRDHDGARIKAAGIVLVPFVECAVYISDARVHQRCESDRKEIEKSTEYIGYGTRFRVIRNTHTHTHTEREREGENW